MQVVKNFIWKIHRYYSGKWKENSNNKARLKKKRCFIFGLGISKKQYNQTSDPEYLYDIPNMDNGVNAELWDRWSMQKTPPDILITNYSMLNIMLMRPLENDIFEKN